MGKHRSVNEMNKFVDNKMVVDGITIIIENPEALPLAIKRINELIIEVVSMDLSERRNQSIKKTT
jgi:hypothetical protein